MRWSVLDADEQPDETLDHSSDDQQTEDQVVIAAPDQNIPRGQANRQDGLLDPEELIGKKCIIFVDIFIMQISR